MTEQQRPSEWPPGIHDGWDKWNMSRNNIFKALGCARRILRSKNPKGKATSAAHEGCRSGVILGRRLLMLLEQTQDAHKAMIEAVSSEKTGALLKGMYNDQAGRDMKQYQE